MSSFAFMEQDFGKSCKNSDKNTQRFVIVVIENAKSAMGMNTF